MIRSEAPCNSAENRDPTLSTLGTWFRIVGTLASGKKSLCAGGQATAIRTWRYTPALAVPDNHPGAYFWRLTNGKVPKTFHVEDTKWWLLELIPIELKEGK
jgi:hypothetical protein